MSAKQKQIELTSKFSVANEWHVGDPVRFRQVLFNLVSNAIKFTPEGGRVSISATNDNQHPEVVRVGVIDTGIGIDKASMPHLFMVQTISQVQLLTPFRNSFHDPFSLMVPPTELHPS